MAPQQTLDISRTWDRVLFSYAASRLVHLFTARLDYVLNYSPVDEAKLPREPKQLVQDKKKCAHLRTTEFVFHTQAVYTNSLEDHAAERVGDSQPLDNDKAKEDGDQAAKHLRTLLTLVLVNSELRKHLCDFFVIGCDQGLNPRRPTRNKLARVDEPALQVRFITHDLTAPTVRAPQASTRHPYSVAQSRSQEPLKVRFAWARSAAASQSSTPRTELKTKDAKKPSRNLFPNIIAVESHHYMKSSPYDGITGELYLHSRFDKLILSPDNVTLADDQHLPARPDPSRHAMSRSTTARSKKSRLPRMKDSGLADVTLGGDGLCASVTIVFTSSTSHEKSSVFKVQDVYVKVKGDEFPPSTSVPSQFLFSHRITKRRLPLRVRLLASFHHLLCPTLTLPPPFPSQAYPLTTGLVKKQICKALKDGIVTARKCTDGQLFGVRDRMNKARAEEGRSRIEVLQALPPHQVPITSHGASVSTSYWHFKVVSNERDSPLRDVRNPVGWANRSPEKEVKVKQGHRWRSEAFNIVPTSN
ncbi:hypothetical protein FA13DRAFT_1800677 [Coprinellus micaceus]|uniref:Uncharacterized protein n=1 Tax=Coprinellus micaceus TaxID=71717 RepID=A0A4Y7SG46_COPMI|nr:hypothetical protein FA13DRAFT_1800677 [Coprinellus micaceus]